MKPEESHKLIHYAKTAVISLALSFFVIAPVLADNAPVPQDNHAYTLTKVDQAGENTITKYEWSDSENKYVPVYYRVDLSKTEYGNPNGDTTLTFGWEKNADGDFEFKQNPATPVGQTITYKYNSSDAQTRFTNSTDNSSKTTTGVFVKSTSSKGGAIYNNGSNAKLGDINSDFIGNYAQGSSGGYGGAIYNVFYGTIGNITGDFIGNYAQSDSRFAYGGAIHNERGTIGNITGDFIGNYAQSKSSSARGGAIYNDGTIESITGDFIGNYAQGSYEAEGGAIYNSGTIGNITGDFIGNYAQYDSRFPSGGAIHNYGTIGNITGDFIGNYVQSDSYYARGGAIYNTATGNASRIESIKGDFIGNYAQSDLANASGGAIYNSGTIGNITGDFIGNYALSAGTGSTSTTGGAIYNHGTIKNIKGDFIGNYAQSETGNALGGAIYNEEIINAIVNSDFIDNYAVSENGEAKGGAIYTTQDLNIAAQDGGQSVFFGNYTESNGVKTPNAIYVETTTGLNIRNIISINESNIVTETKNANIPVLTLNANTNGTIRFDDTIDGNLETINITTTSADLAVRSNYQSLYGVSTVAEFVEYIKANPTSFWWYTEGMTDTEILTYLYNYNYLDTSNAQITETTQSGYSLNITGDSTGKVILNNDVINANISLDNTNLYLGRDNVFDKSQSLTLNSGSMSMINNQAGTMNIPTVNLNGTTNLGVDVDLANKQMDTIKAENYNVAENAKLNVNSINLLNDAKQDKTDILFTDNKDLASATAYTGASPIAYSPIYKYEVAYNPDEGFFTFTRGGGSGNPSDNFNPSVLAPSVIQQAGAYTTQLQTFNYAFQHADTFMNIPYLERVAMKNTGRYAVSPTGDATDVGTFSPLLTKEQDAGFWVKPYASFENIPLNNGPKVSNINYGTLVGYDSSLTPVAKGWERVLTGYIGYNGASQRYSGVDAYQNGGILGGTATMYKGNFFNATTLSVGATAGDASTMYGNENYAMLLAGIGNKTGYNFEFKDGRIILQPNFLISYTFVNTFDYTNGAGVRIKSDPLNAIQLAPGLKLIGNTKTGWQPYLSVAMVWNLLDDSKVTANDVRLPEMSIDPYVQYGAGIQKRFKDRFIAFGQAMIHNGGRNGVSLTGGIRWSVGK